jgi:hypothetical protein
LDIDDLSDLPIFIGDWQRALARQVQRLDDEHSLTDGYFLVVAAHQLLLVCHQYADHDPNGEVRSACNAFEVEHPNLRVLRNMLMHSDDYYRGTGNDPDSRGVRTFTYFMSKHDGDWHLSQGGTAAGQCNLSKVGDGRIAVGLQQPCRLRSWRVLARTGCIRRQV